MTLPPETHLVEMGGSEPPNSLPNVVLSHLRHLH